MAFQETHTTTDHENFINVQFQASQSLWTRHCGLLSFSSKYQLSDNLIPSNPRIILSKISHPQNFYAPFHVLVVYAPASTGKDRREFFDSVLDALNSVPDIDPHRIIILGDFNYSYHRHNLSTQTSLKWVSYLEESFYNVMHSGDNSNIPTFRRNDEIYSTIDYIFISNQMRPMLKSTDIRRLHSSWTDHQLLSLSINLGQTPTGFGLWRANPILAQQKAYRVQLKQQLTGIISSLPSQMTAQEQWDYVKSEIRLFTQRYAVDYTNWRKKSIKVLQRKRNAFLRSQPPIAIRLQCLPVMDQQIESLQQELVDIAALKAGIRWREHGEKSAGYLKRIHQVRTVEQSINCLQDTTSGSTVSSRTQLLEVSQAFYQELYSVDPVDEHDIDCYLQDIADLPQLTEDDRRYLISPITIEDIIEQSKKVIGKQSSPGSDGLGYVFMHLIYQFSPLKDLITKIYNTALATGSFPSSWQDLRVRLLPKKGDLSTLKNWRPISLINYDAKIYTRIINQRMRSVMDTIINRYQTGFLGDRFIAENGMILNILMEQAHVQKRPEIGLLLDQEKAYDRVHPMYLRQTMLAFGFPPSLVHSLESLFFGNAVRININGYFTNRIYQRRGLRQGDPLSPLLFNIALEPFLRHILQDSSFQGFQFQVVSNSATTTSNTMPPPLKVLAYADDVCVLLHSTDDYCRLRHHLDRYGSVSNAKVNIHKTEAFSLDGRSYPEWIAFLAVQGISKWHDHSSPSPLRYLGFPLIQSFHQRRYLEQQLLQTVKSQCTIYSQRRLSIKGRVTIVNALILSKLWYVLRMVHLPTTFFRRLNSVIYQFVWHNCKPKIKYTQLCLNLKLGGLGLLDPQIQRHNLQIRWLRQLLEDNHPQSCSQPILLDHIRRFHSGNTGTRLALFFPLLRLRPAAHANNFMQNIYEAVDSFGYADTDQAKCTPATLLRLPLSAIFTMIPTDYWITRSRHKKLKVSQFFTYDHHFGCIRPLLSSDQPSSPRLVSKLSRDIHNRIIKLNQLIWPHILNQNQPFGEVVDSAFIDAFCLQPHWINYKPKPFRLSLIQRSLPSSAMPQIPTSKWSLFWKMPVSPESRSLWYRLFHRKLYSQSLLSRFDNGLTPSQCKFCSANTEDLQHLFVRCPMKWRVWIDAFNFFNPHLTFTQDNVCSILWSFQQFTFVDNTDLCTLSCCVLSVIWRAHWRFTIDDFSFTDKQLVTRAMSQFATLKRGRLDLD